MANFTELTALETAIEALANVEGFNPDALAKLEKMADNRRKNRNGKSTYQNSKAAQEVRERAAGVLGFLLQQTEPVTNKIIGEAVPGFLDAMGGVSSRRVVAACSKLEKQGMIEKTGKNKAGYTLYQATAKAREEWNARNAA